MRQIKDIKRHQALRIRIYCSVAILYKKLKEEDVDSEWISYFNRVSDLYIIPTEPT